MSDSNKMGGIVRRNDPETFGGLLERVNRMYSDLYEGPEPVVRTWTDYLAVQKDRDRREREQKKADDKKWNIRIAIAGLFFTAVMGGMELYHWHQEEELRARDIQIQHEIPNVVVQPQPAAPANVNDGRASTK